MHIQWFPGHMTRAVRMMEEQAKLCDGIVYVLDSRAPYACLNKNNEKIFKNKSILYVFNKSDLVESEELNKVLNDFKSQNKFVISVVGTNEKCKKQLYNAIFSLLKEKVDKYKSKGINRALRVMVAGIPNTGKSTIINMLCGGKKAKTGDKAGVTKDKQWIKINDLEFLDTPGTTPPSFENQEYAIHLAFIGSLNDDILDFIELSLNLIEQLVNKDKTLIEKCYNLSIENQTSKEIFDMIALKRGAVKKGGIIDEERISNIIINDFRKGKLGKILFE